MPVLNRIRKRKFGDILLAQGMTTKDQLQEALDEQKTTGEFLGEVLIRKGIINESEIAATLSIQYQLPFLRASNYEVSRDLVEKFKPEFLYRNRLLPIDRVGGFLMVCCSDIPNDRIIEEIERTLQGNVAIYVNTSSDIAMVLNQYVPISEEDKESFRTRKVVEKEVAKAAPPAEITVESESDLDNSWESIFDQAESNLQIDE